MRDQSTESYPAGYDWRARFPDARHLRSGEGEGAHAAEGEGAFWIIIDSGTMADFLGEEDAGMELIHLRRYDDRDTWQREVEEIVREERLRQLRGSYGGHPYAGRRVDVLVHDGRGQKHVRLPLGPIWRSRNTEQLLMTAPGDHGPDDFVPFVEILDEHGLLTLGRTTGSYRFSSLRAECRLVSDPDEVCALLKENPER